MTKGKAMNMKMRKTWQKPALHNYRFRGTAADKELVEELRKRYPQGIPFSKVHAAMPEASFLCNYVARQRIPVDVVADEMSRLRTAALSTH